MAPATGSTIVIADDFGAFRRLVRPMLLASGFQIVGEATNGLEVVASVARFRPDIVLLDLSMPKLNGIAAAAQIRSLAPKSKVLFVSLDTDPDIIQTALSDGAMGYIRKSAINRDLLPAIEAALAGKRFVSSDLRTRA